MYLRTTSAFFSIIVCTSAFWNVKATTTGVTPTEGHSSDATSISTENLPPDTPASPNSTFNDDSTTAVHSTELPLTTTPTPVKKSSEAGSSTIASTTFHSSVAVSETSHVSSTVSVSTTLLSSVAVSTTGHMSSTVNNNVTVLPAQETSTPQGNITMIIPMEPNTTLVSDKNGNGMKYSETILTSIFSTILVVVLLTILIFGFNKYRKRRSQYSHHPLREHVYESEGYSPPDDTLVISGGLYDAPRIYNPNMTVLEEDSQHDFVSFSSRPGQFRLEFLPGDNDMDSAYNGSLKRNV